MVSFSTLTLADLGVGNRKLVTVQEQELIGEVLKKFSQANIYCVPVLTADNKVKGLLDLTDLLTFLTSIYLEKANVAPGKNKDTIVPFFAHIFDPSDVSLLHDKFFKATAGEIVNRSGKNGFFPKPATTTLDEVINTLAKEELTRIPVVDEQGSVLYLVSQSTIISYLAKHNDLLGDKAALTIKSANIGTRKLLVVPENVRAIDAFVFIIENGLSSVGFLGDDGGVAGNISVKDIKGVLLEDRALFSPVSDYVNIIRRDSINDTLPLINVHDTDTVSKAIGKLAAVGIHRLYLFGEGKGPEGIVSLRDILSLFRN